MLSGLSVRHTGAAARLSGPARARVFGSAQRQLSTHSLRRPTQLHGIARGEPSIRPALGNGASQARALSLWPFGRKKVEAPGAAGEEPAVAAQGVNDSTTTPAPANPPADAVPPTETAASSLPDPSALDTAAAAAPSYTGIDALDAAAASLPLDLSHIPEGWGYLHALGLDYGWGPSTIMEHVLEALHFTGGLPWWAAAIASSLLIRAALFPATIGAADTAARMARIKDRLTPLNERMVARYRAGDQAGALVLRKKVADLQAAHGVKSWKAMLPLLQVPFGFGVFRVMRGMAALPVPGMEGEGVAWLSDITVQDPYYVLPLATAGLLYWSLKKGGENGAANLSTSTMATAMRYGLPLSTAVFMAFWPGMLQLYFATSGVWSLAQTYALQTPRARAFLGVAPLPERKTPVAPPETAEQKLKRLRTLAWEKEVAAAEAAAAREAERNALAKLKDQGVQSVEKMRAYVGRETQKAAEKAAGGKKKGDGRFTETQRKEAAEWEKRRAEEEQTEREALNSRLKEEWERMQARRAEMQRQARTAAGGRRRE